MNPTRTPGDRHADIHDTRLAFQTGLSSPAQVLEHAAAIAQSEACRHVFMPGTVQNVFNRPNVE
ncbi:hypothetical protein LP417_32645 [Polaromonas sp. P1-6]|nr:hypothetical protein LP417_32645 [Polaromonas sp. P1-6]